MPNALHGAHEAQNGKKMFDGTSAILAAELPSLGKQECPSFWSNLTMKRASSYSEQDKKFRAPGNANMSGKNNNQLEWNDIKWKREFLSFEQIWCLDNWSNLKFIDCAKQGRAAWQRRNADALGALGSNLGIILMTIRAKCFERLSARKLTAHTITPMLLMLLVRNALTVGLASYKVGPWRLFKWQLIKLRFEMS